MKLAAGIITLLVGLGLGATVLHDAVPVSSAQNQAQTQPQNSASSTSSSAGTSSGTTSSGTVAQQPIKPLNPTTAKLQNEANTISIVQRFEPGLVYISTFTQVIASDPLAQLYGQGQGGAARGTPTEQPQGVGSGFFVDSSGDILTNFHVVGEADAIEIRLLGAKQTYKADVIGKAPEYDLALIRPRNIPKNLIRPIPLGDSDAVQAGQKAIAMGAPFGFDFSVTEGIISAVNRRVPVGLYPNGQSADISQRTLQTDAAINPGNSGGPLLDSTGRVVGINTQIISPSGAQSGTGQSAGVGFAIPINTAKTLLPRLKNAGGGIVNPPRIGVTVFGASLSQFPTNLRQQYNLPDHGVLVQSVAPDSPAAAAGIKGGSRKVDVGAPQPLLLGGDVIVAAGGEPVDGLEDLKAVLIEKQLGDTVKLTVRRGGKDIPVSVKLTKYSFQPDKQQ